MEKKHSKFASLLFLFWMLVTLLACNLGGGEEQPILETNPTPSPQPTIGHEQLNPSGLSSQSNPAGMVDAELFNLLNEVESDRLIVHVDTLSGLYTRHVNSSKTSITQGVGAGYNYILSQFESIQVQSPENFYIFPHEFALRYNEIDSIQRNIAAVITGTEMGAGTILIGAHYDSVSSNIDDSEAYAPGADDNASGVAMMIELARILSKRPHRATIMFVAFSAEEVGRRGSIAFVNDYIKSRNIQLNGMINLDTLGNYNDRNNVINDRQMRVFSAGPNSSPSRHLARSVNFIAFNLASGIEIVVQDAIDREGRYGDHETFSSAGYPAIRFIEALEDTANRDSRDTVDQIDSSYLTQATRTVLAVVTSLADGPRPPRNIALRDKGNGLHSLVWEPVPGAASYMVALRSPYSIIYDYQFDVADTTVDWDGFVSSRFVGLAIAAKDGNGLLGPLSTEYIIP